MINFVRKYGMFVYRVLYLIAIALTIAFFMSPEKRLRWWVLVISIVWWLAFHIAVFYWWNEWDDEERAFKKYRALVIGKIVEILANDLPLLMNFISEIEDDEENDDEADDDQT